MPKESSIIKIYMDSTILVLYQCISFSFLDLLLCTNEPNVSIPQLADLLIQRTNIPNWIVVFKALVSVHNLMNYGNEVSTIHCTFVLSLLFNTVMKVELPTN